MRGLNLYIENGNFYIGGWNDNIDDGGATTPWDYTTVSSAISANTPYFAILQFDFDDLTMTGEVRGSLNGIDLGALPGAGKLFSQPGDIGIGGQSNGACYIGDCDGGNANFFDGYITEFVSGNEVFNDAQMKIIHNYMSAKYNISLPDGDDIYDFETDYGYELFGVGQENAANSHYIAQGSGIIRIENPSSAADGRYLMIGHDNGSINDWKEWDELDTPNSNQNIQRVERVWKVDKQGGDIGTIRMRLDTLDLPSKTFGFPKYVILIDADGDFTSGARTIELEHDGAQYHSISGIQLNKGDYFTIGIVKPDVEFKFKSSSAGEPVTTSDPTKPAFIVVLNYESNNDVTVDYATIDGTAIAGNDYIAESGTVTIPAGDTSALVNIAILNDTDVETDETFQIQLSNPSSGTALGANSVQTFTINDDDNARKVEFTNSTGIGDESTSPVNVEVRINIPDAANYTSFYYTITAGQATEGAGQDFVMAYGSDSIAPGGSSFTVNLPAILINDDALYENDETFEITLSNPRNANLGANSTYTYTITDNDSEPSVEFANAAGSGSESFNPSYLEVRLSALSGEDISVDYAATDNNGTGGGIDYTLTSGTLTIPAGTDSTNILVEIFNDIIDEPTESFTVTLSNPVNATLGPISSINYSIYDDDGLGYVGPGGVGDNTQYRVWFKPDEESYADGEPVSVLNDLSLNGHDATSSGENRPIFQSDAGNMINGRPIIAYDGSDDYLELPDSEDINTSSYTQKTIVIAFKTGADITSRQLIFEEGGGTNGINIYIDGGNLYYAVWAYGFGWGYVNVSTAPGVITTNTEYSVILELDTDNQLLAGYLNGNLIGTATTGTEELGPHGGDVGLGAQRNHSYFYEGNDGSSSAHYFNGDILEFVYYNYLLNSADKKLIDNYIAAKFRNNIETGLTNDFYSYRATHNYEVFGIGQDDTDNNRIVSQGSGIIRIDNPSSMNDGDYLLIGHDNSAYGNWSATGVPYDSVQRFNRIWLVDETGDCGNVRLGLDTTIIPSKPVNYEKYVLLVDANTDDDFDMSTTATDVNMYPMNTKSGAMRLAAAVDFNPGDVFTIGVARNRTISDGDWNSNATWLLNTVPDANEPAIITDGHIIDITSDVRMGDISIGTGSVINLNNNELILNGTTFLNNGTLNIGTGTINYGGNVDQCVEPLSYYNLKISGNGTKTLCGDISVNNNLLIQGFPANLTFDDDGYDIDLIGD